MKDRAPAVVVLVAAVLGTLAACGGNDQRAAAHRSPLGTPAASVPLLPSGLPTATPTTPAMAATSLPARPTSAPTPAGIPHVSQRLTFSGAVQGAVDSAEVKQCGSSDAVWSLQMSNISLPGEKVSISLSVPSFSGPGVYRPQGTLMTISGGQASFYAVSQGTLQMASARQGTLDLQFQGAGTIHVTGGWVC